MTIDSKSAIDPEQAAAKAAVLAEALPWLRDYHGSTVVIKYGGNAMVDDKLKASFAADIVFLHLAGLHPVVVHGGGPQISDMLRRLNIPSEFRAGVRVTTPEVLDVARMVLTGQVQRELVNLINRHGPFAVGVSGEDASLFEASALGVDHEGKSVDVGLVGEVTSVRASLVETLITDRLIPVVSSIGVGVDGTVYNINADTAAAALAVGLKADKLIFMTDVSGLYADYPDPDSVISQLSEQDLMTILPTLERGMIPKMGACLTAVQGGVNRAHVIDGRLEHSILLEVFTDQGIGTMVYRSQPGQMYV
ncbi:MAG: acetylglutamate kinase [Actinomycetes bacterium]